MLLLGYISLFQILYLPGALWLKALNIQERGIKKIFFAFGLSLIANYCLVFALTSLGLYTRPIVYTIFCFELLLLLYLDFENIKQFMRQSLVLCIKNVFIQTFLKLKFLNQHLCLRDNDQKKYVQNWVIFGMAFLSLFIIFLEFLKGFPSLAVFCLGDDIASWNRWAIDWFSNRLPVLTWHYPQLIPANWSIAYVFMGAPVQYVVKLIMPLFTVFTAAFMISLGIKQKSIKFFLATTVFLLYLYGSGAWNFVSSGYVDLSVSCIGFLSVYCLLLINKDDSLEIVQKYLFLGSLFASGACVTKQTGLFIFIVYPLLAFLILKINARVNFGLKKMLCLLVTHLLMGLIIVAPFYVYKEIEIMRGLASSEISWVTEGIYKGASLFQRFYKAWISYFGLNLLCIGCWVPTSIMCSIFYLAIFMCSLKDRVYRYLFFIVLVPYWLIWSFFYSYNLRNSFFIGPFYALGIGTGIEFFLSLNQGFLFNSMRSIVLWVKRASIVMCVGLLFLGIIFLSKKYSMQCLLERQDFSNLSTVVNSAIDVTSLGEKAGYLIVPGGTRSFFEINIDEKLKEGLMQSIYASSKCRVVKVKRVEPKSDE